MGKYPPERCYKSIACQSNKTTNTYWPIGTKPVDIFVFFPSKSNSTLNIERAKRENKKDAVYEREVWKKSTATAELWNEHFRHTYGVWNESSKLPIYYIHWAIICGWLNCRKKRKLSISTWSFTLGLFHCVFFFIIIAILFMRNKAIGIESRNRFM